MTLRTIETIVAALAGAVVAVVAVLPAVGHMYALGKAEGYERGYNNALDDYDIPLEDREEYFNTPKKGE